jgi:hypothetical protein
MPPREIRAVLVADDPLLVRRVLELHRERLGEWLEEQQGLAATIERSLAGQPRAVPSGRSERPRARGNPLGFLAGVFQRSVRYGYSGRGRKGATDGHR